MKRWPNHSSRDKTPCTHEPCVFRNPIHTKRGDGCVFADGLLCFQEHQSGSFPTANALGHGRSDCKQVEEVLQGNLVGVPFGKQPYVGIVFEVENDDGAYG